MSRPQDDRNQEATVYLVSRIAVHCICSGELNILQGNLDERCSDALVWELMLQAGPVGAYQCSHTIQGAELDLCISQSMFTSQKTVYL